MKKLLIWIASFFALYGFFEMQISHPRIALAATLILAFCFIIYIIRLSIEMNRK